MDNNSETKTLRKISNKDTFDEINSDDDMSVRPPVPAPRKFLPTSIVSLSAINTAEHFQ